MVGLICHSTLVTVFYLEAGLLPPEFYAYVVQAASLRLGEWYVFALTLVYVLEIQALCHVASF